ncbi:carnosine N-methyltransferase [Macrosteles quadrilineatus]|uniref:carnosine N-methyltransferase n=1 Tax=Macrosteles quadrilineatus TaxID=74068 RepID=UPI0023E1291E|nr:carnosine N-methyltransferase [Macrosteles quadrilineatus]
MNRTYSRKKPGTMTEKTSSPAMNKESLPSRTKVPLDDEEETKHFQRVVAAFESYKSHLSQKITVTKQLLESLPDHQQHLLRNYKGSFSELGRCVEHNQNLLDFIIKDVEYMFENTNPSGLNEPNGPKPSVMDIERVQTTLKQFVRDWSEEGKSERNACYQPIVDEVVNNFPPASCNTQSIKVLVPGSGLGRLAFEIAHRGYTCQGNEFSLFMLFASNFVLNRCNGVNLYSVYPWIHQVENNMTADHQMQQVYFPDINPNSLLKNGASQFTMAAGDFLEIYQNPEDWDCVATCFFIDCANNVVDFIEKIYDILKPGGVWINLGPLLYHYSNMTGEFSIEPPYSVVKEVITEVGFVIEKEEVGLKTKYGQNPHSMLQYEYRSVFFVCRKPTDQYQLTREDNTNHTITNPSVIV